jgi:hypothetical protein
MLLRQRLRLHQLLPLQLPHLRPRLAAAAATRAAFQCPRTAPEARTWHRGRCPSCPCHRRRASRSHSYALFRICTSREGGRGERRSLTRTGASAAARSARAAAEVQPQHPTASRSCKSASRQRCRYHRGFAKGSPPASAVVAVELALGRPLAIAAAPTTATTAPALAPQTLLAAAAAGPVHITAGILLGAISALGTPATAPATRITTPRATPTTRIGLGSIPGGRDRSCEGRRGGGGG